jgi:hypothetical protein
MKLIELFIKVKGGASEKQLLPLVVGQLKIGWEHSRWNLLYAVFHEFVYSSSRWLICLRWLILFASSDSVQKSDYYVICDFRAFIDSHLGNKLCRYWAI